MTKVLQAWTDIASTTENWFTLKYQMWADPYDIANNRTKVWRRLLLSVADGGSLGAISYEYSATGMASASGGAVSFTAGDYVLLSSEGYVTHNADGTWSQAVSGSVNFGNYIFWNCSGTAELETIPRTSHPTLSASSCNIGSSVTIYTNRASTSFTHDITAKFGSSSTVHNIASNVTDSAKFNSGSFVSALVDAQSSGKTTVAFTVTTKSESVTIGSDTVSLSVKINPSVPTVNKSSILVGETVTLSTNRSSSSRTHTVVVKAGSATLTTLNNVGASVVFDTDDYRTAIMSAIGVSNKSIKLTFTVTTNLNGTAIGTKSVSLTANVNTNTYYPEIVWGAMTDTSTVANYHGSNEMINGLSALSQVINFTTSSQYSELASAKITYGGVTTNKTLSGRTGTHTLTATSVTTNTITVSVTDKRGTTVSDTKTFTLLGYAPPTLTKSSVSRVNMTGSEAKYSLSGTGYAGTYTGSSSITNSITVWYRYKEANASSWAVSFAVLGTASLSGDGSKPWEIKDTFSDQFDYTKQYDIQFRLRDGFNELTQSYYTLRLYNGTPVFGWAETHFDVYGKFHIHDRTNASERWVFPDALDAMMYTQGSKNLLQCTSSATTYRGVEYTYDSWNRPTANGTATGGNSYILYGHFVCQRAGDYTFSGCPTGGGGSTYYLQVRDTDSTVLGNDFGSGVTLTCTNNTTYRVYIIIPDGVTVSSVKFAPMVRNAMLASTTYTPFAPPFSQLGNFALMAKGTISNANSATDLGIYRVTSGSNTPATSGLLVTLNPFLWADESSLRWQIFFTSTPVMYMRYRGSDGTWTAWRTVTSS